jgi:hypothetical protein
VRLPIIALSLCLQPALQAASPVDFGRREFLEALETRGLKPERFKVITEHSMVLPADGYSIQGYLIRGGNLRGIMYGLLEAAGQIRMTGHLRLSKAHPAISARGVRWEQPLPSDPTALFAAMARARFNRFVAAHGSESLETLRRASETATAHGLDFGVVLPEGASPRDYVSALPLVKFIEAAPTQDHLDELASAGRLFTLDLDASKLDEASFSAAKASRIPLQVCAEPAATGTFLEKPEVSDRTRAWRVIWRLRNSPAAGPKAVRALLQSLSAGGAQGFELTAPVSPAPGFYEIWGRLAYDSSVADENVGASSKPPAALIESLEAASALPPDGTLAPLEQMLALPEADPWVASPAESVKLRLEKRASAKSLPLDRAAVYAATASRLEKLTGVEPALKPVALHARLSALRLSAAVHLAWARAAGDSAALTNARQDAEAALKLDPANAVLQSDAALLENHPPLPAPPGKLPNRFTGIVTKPVFQHAPLRQAPARQPLRVVLAISSTANLRTVRLHWRQLSRGPWQTIEAAPSSPVFSIPAAAITPAYDIEYFFEILHDLGGGWSHPENVAGTISGFPARFVVQVN